MSLDSAWRRFDASRWMHRLLVLQTIVLAWATAAVAFLGLFSGRFGAAVLAALLPAALTALSGWFAAAWSREQAWTWWAVLVLQVVGLAAAVMASGAGDVVR